MSTVTSPIDTPAGHGSGDALWHLYVLDGPRVSLCGAPVDDEDIPYEVEVSGGECVVCHDLAERFMDGTWRP